VIRGVTSPLVSARFSIILLPEWIQGTKTQGEIEAAICESIRQFEQEYMGRGPKGIHTHVLGELLVVRLVEALTLAEQHLAKSLPTEKGRDLLKQSRTHLIETARPLLESIIGEFTGVKVLSLHHDISTVTGEEIMVFTLAEPPLARRKSDRFRDHPRATPAIPPESPTKCRSA
jgi:uncharacterized protein YbcI